MVTENGRAELRGFATDPARPLRVRLGPVVAASRRSVMRVGLLVLAVLAERSGARAL